MRVSQRPGGEDPASAAGGFAGALRPPLFLIHAHKVGEWLWLGLSGLLGG